MYRVIAAESPTLSDFESQRSLNPDKHFTNVDECTARGVSLWADLGKCQRLLLFPAFAGKRIAEVKLLANAGSIAQTGQRRSHYSWWRCAAYDPLPHCTVLP